MRPKTIALFEIFMLAAIALRAIKFAAEWDGMTRLAGSRLSLMAVGLNLSITLLLTLLISRSRSKTAMWTLITLVVLNLPFFVVGSMKGIVLSSGLISIVQVAAQLIACCLLFTPSAKTWLDPVPIDSETVPDLISETSPN